MAWAAQPGPQYDAIEATWCRELLYGGARGGGKSDYLLADFLQDVPTYSKAWQGILIRRTYPELLQLIRRAREMFPATGATERDEGREWTWPNGAGLIMRYAERETDVGRYQGHEFAWIGWDELTQWATPEAYLRMFANLRMAPPTKRVRASANPGGHGHSWVKARFIDPAPTGYQPIRDEATGEERMFIPARVGDNQILLARDPAYVNRLRGVGSEQLVRAWLLGDWSVIEGAFFGDVWSSEKHVIRPFTPPAHWLRFVGFDWGSAAPFAVGWWCVSDGNRLPDGRLYPTGAIIQYREWYGASAPNVGLKLTAEQVADGIVQREIGEAGKITYRVADPSCWKVDGGPSIAERMAKRHVVFGPADNSRINGWDQLRARLLGDDYPMLYVFATCVDLIRTLPAVQHDEDHPEDVDSDGEDHAPDAARYACMSRPFTRKLPHVGPMRGVGEMTIDEAWKLGRKPQGQRI
jgi:hypothetical protein